MVLVQILLYNVAQGWFILHSVASRRDAVAYSSRGSIKAIVFHLRSTRASTDIRMYVEYTDLQAGSRVGI